MASHNKITNKVLASSQRGEESSHTGHSVPGYSDTAFQAGQFPPSPQSDLFNYLRPEQQEFLKPILRVLKKPAQEELCVALIDYLETGIPEPPVTFNLGVIFMYIIHGCEPKGSDPADRKFLYPLHEVLAASQSKSHVLQILPSRQNIANQRASATSSNRFSTSKKQYDYD